jgi:putative DNA modification/repair radical SAM protein
VDIAEKLRILAGSARYDASCATSGSRRPGGFTGARFGNAIAPGICHSFADDGRCIALLKVLFTNVCVNDCAYCANRRSRDVPRASFTVEELVTLTESFYRRNYIEGLFLSSGVVVSPDHTMDLLIKTVKTLRLEKGFGGYVHLKVIPGASPVLVREAGFWADRISANIELPTETSLRLLAPQKTGHAILSSMGHITRDIDVNRSESKIGRLLSVPARSGCGLRGLFPDGRPLASLSTALSEAVPSAGLPSVPWPGRPTLTNAAFAPAGQSTQLIVGASPESDRKILGLSERLYGRYRLRRVYYSAFVPVSGDPRLPVVSTPPLRREHRLYQADWLLRFYGFGAEEILSEEAPFLDLDLDPKSSWALRNMGGFPIEVCRADYETLLRVPGLGQKSAERIVEARRHGALSFDTLKKIGVVMKRARYFITCSGKALEGGDLPLTDLRLRLRQADPRSDLGNGQPALFEEAAT